jgi:hypothetical protein
MWILYLLSTRNVSQPHFGKVWGWHSHSWNGDLRVLWDSQNFRARLQGSKHLALRCFLYHLKAIKVKMSKMASHEPFGDMQHKLWQKKGLGGKSLKVGNRPDPGMCKGEWDTLLESSQGELQVCFGPHPNRRSEQRVMNSQSPESPNQDSFETPPGES